MTPAIRQNAAAGMATLSGMNTNIVTAATISRLIRWRGPHSIRVSQPCDWPQKRSHLPLRQPRTATVGADEGPEEAEARPGSVGSGRLATATRALRASWLRRSFASNSSQLGVGCFLPLRARASAAVVLDCSQRACSLRSFSTASAKVEVGAGNAARSATRS